MELEILRAYQQASRERAVEEMFSRPLNYAPALLTLREIDAEAIEQYETWRTPYDFGWERMLTWKDRPAHYKALDIAIWYGGTLVGLCWASPKNSHEKIFVLYLERNPDDSLLTRGYVAPLCLSAVRNYGMLMALTYVVINDPLPESRRAYIEQGFIHHPGIGLAYDLSDAYDCPNDEVSKDDQQSQ